MNNNRLAREAEDLLLGAQSQRATAELVKAHLEGCWKCQGVILEGQMVRVEGTRVTHTNCLREARREFEFWAVKNGTFILDGGIGSRGGIRHGEAVEVALTVTGSDENTVSWSAMDRYGNSYELTWHRRRRDWPRGWRKLGHPHEVEGWQREGL